MSKLYSPERPWYQGPPDPKSALGRYRLLSPNASVRVSPLCLGTMNFGDAWEYYMGKCDKETTMRILDYFYDQGGNFIDTANNYQYEESEAWVGEWMAKRKNRDQMVIATKYTTAYRAGHGEDEIIINSTGNGTKSLHTSLAASLKKLQTDYVDVLYVHWWDFGTSIEELMQSLNTMVQQGKVLYLGVSDTPAWVVSKCNQYARDHGLRGFSVYQGQYNASKRDMERDIIPMCNAEGMGVAPWGALGSGNFRSKEQQASKVRASGPSSEADIKISDAMEKIAKAKNTQITSVALAYVMTKSPYMYPILGGRNIDHLKSNIAALSLELSEDDIKAIEDANAFDPGFPHTFLGGGKGATKSDDNWILNLAGITDYVQPPKPIRPAAQ